MYVPLNCTETTFEDTKTFSKAVAVIMQKNYPDLVTAKMAKEHRKARVFINWSQNDSTKTMICVYSLRAREKPVRGRIVELRRRQRLAVAPSPGDEHSVIRQQGGAVASGADLEQGRTFREGHRGRVVQVDVIDAHRWFSLHGGLVGCAVCSVQSRRWQP